MTPGSPLRLAVACLLAVASWPLLAAEKGRTFTVKVVDANGAPLAGVTVEAFGLETNAWRGPLDADPLAKATTGKDGRFSFEAPDVRLWGQTVAVAHKKGLDLGWVNWWPGVTGELTLTLAGGGAVLAGTVVDSVGKPVTGAEVRPLLMIMGGPTRRRFLPGLSPVDVLVARTDARGRFRLAGIPKATRAELVVFARGKAKTFTMRAGVQFGQLRPGNTDIRIAMADEAKVSGKVVDKKTARPVAGVRVTARPRDFGVPFGFDEVTTGKDGRFVIGSLPPGKVAVITLGPKSGLGKWVPIAAEVDLKAGRTAKDIKLELVRGGVLEVSVTDANTGAPVAEARVETRLQGVFVFAAPGRGSAHSRADGVARIRLAPGKHTLSVVQKYGVYKCYPDGKDFEIAEGKTRKLAVKLQRLPVLRGLVRDGEGRPVKGAEIALMPAYLLSSRYPHAILTDEKGRFKMALNTADYGFHPKMTCRVVARLKGRNLVGAAEIGKGVGAVEIKLAPGGRVAGQVVDRAGKAIAGARVVAWPGQSSVAAAYCLIETPTDAKGRYELQALLPGAEHVVRANARGYGAVSVNVDIPKKPKAPVQMAKLLLKPANLSVSGVVSARDGKPAAGVSVYAGGDAQPDFVPRVTTDKKGRFKINNLAEGKAFLSATSEDGKLMGSVEADAGKTGVEIQLKPFGSGSPEILIMPDWDEFDLLPLPDSPPPPEPEDF